MTPKTKQALDLAQSIASWDEPRWMNESQALVSKPFVQAIKEAAKAAKEALEDDEQTTPSPLPSQSILNTIEVLLSKAMDEAEKDQKYPSELTELASWLKLANPNNQVNQTPLAKREINSDWSTASTYFRGLGWNEAIDAINAHIQAAKPVAQYFGTFGGIPKVKMLQPVPLGAQLYAQPPMAKTPQIEEAS